MAPKILPNLWQVGGAGFSSPEDAAIYLVRFGNKAALVDAGCGNGHDLLKSNISSCIPETVAIEYLLLTHCHFDHTGGAETVRKEYGCRIVAHVLDPFFLESGDSEVTAASWYGCFRNQGQERSACDQFWKAESVFGRISKPSFR